METNKKEYQPSVFAGMFKPYIKDGNVTGWYLIMGALKYKLQMPKNYDPKNPEFILYIENMPPREDKHTGNNPVEFGR